MSFLTRLPFLSSRSRSSPYTRHHRLQDDSSELEAAFGKDEDEEEDHHDETEHLVRGEDLDHDLDGEDLVMDPLRGRRIGGIRLEDNASNVSLPTTAINHHPSPRPLPGSYNFEPQTSVPSPNPSRSFRTRFHLPTFGSGPRNGPVGGGQANDGVFANLTAKPDSYRREDGTIDYVGGDDDGANNKGENLPSYDSAIADSSPPYWDTTVIATSGYLGPEDTLVDGLPVGNFFGFAWNLLVSMSFQFVGFLLTYLLHTTHAARNGSRAGLGITLIQYGLYIRTRQFQNVNLHPSPSDLSDGQTQQDYAFWGSGMIITALPAHPIQTGTPSLYGDLPLSGSGSMAESLAMSGGGMGDEDDWVIEDGSRGFANEWLAFVLMMLGWMMIFVSIVNYWKALRYARALRAASSADSSVEPIVPIVSSTTSGTTTATSTTSPPVTIVVHAA